MLVETFIRKLLHLKALRVTAVKVGSEQIVVEIDRLKCRALTVWGVPGALPQGPSSRGGPELARPFAAPFADDLDGIRSSAPRRGE